MENIKHELIIVISNNGHTDKIMEVAKEQGAKGGTVIHGKGTASLETKKFFGLKIQPEKELTLIVVPKELTNNIIKEISNKYGTHTDVRAISFSLPVSSLVGFNF